MASKTFPSENSNASSAPASNFLQKQEEHTKETNNGEMTTAISNLQKENGWTTRNLVYYQGFWVQEYTLPGIIALQKYFKPLQNQILLTSYPKSGTTWLKALIFAITSRENPNAISHDSSSNNTHIHPLLTKNPHELIPSFEFYRNQNLEHPYPSLPFVSTHIPYQLLPKNAMDSGCKIVYVARNPNDVLVSFWHFATMLRGKELPFFPLQAACEMFCRGASPYGPYWDHVLGFWNASLQFPERVLFLNYDEMKEDAYPHVKRLAEFLGHPFSREEEEEGSIERVISLCSFENLSLLEVNKSGEHNVGVRPVRNEVFFRKGIVGDWENYLSQEMTEHLNGIMAEKFKGSGLKLHLPFKGRRG